MKAEAASVGGVVHRAIASAASATGTDFDFLLKTAVRESSLNPSAKARTSSATGLFQFIDATWLAMMKRYGARHGRAAEAAQIVTDGQGRPTVRDPAARRAILNLRYDADLSARLAGEFTRENANFLRDRIGRDPRAGELYAAHFLGPAGAAELVQTAQRSPDMPASALFPGAASANRSIFYASDGSPRTVRQLVAELGRKIDSGATMSFDRGEPDATTRAPPDAQALMLAQMYATQDAMAQDQILSTLAALFEGKSLADVLATDEGSGGSGGTSGLTLRGRY